MTQPGNVLARRNPLDRVLLLFAEVRAGEGLTAILLTVNLFLLLTAYLIIKTVREALILSEGGAEIKSYAAAGQALLLFALVPTYGYLASRVNRIKLINVTTLFFISNLIAFCLLAQLRIPLGVFFFLWVGIFNLFIIAQFWSFANDIYSEEQGKRLFAIIAFGGSVGAVLGPKLASLLFEPFGPYLLMLVTAGLLGICLVFPNLVSRREAARGPRVRNTSDADKPLDKVGAFQLVIGRRYLMLIAALMIIANVVNTTGEFIMGKSVTQDAQRLASSESISSSTEQIASSSTKEVNSKKVRDYIGRFYGDFLFTVGLISAVAQLLLVSRIMNYCGVPGSLFFLPIVALLGYSTISLIPALAMIRLVKVCENSTDYSLQNTARQALFLPTSREEKYKAKAAIDTFFIRIGDLLSTALVYLSVQLALSLQSLTLINVSLVALWLVIVTGIGRIYRPLAAEQTHVQ
ncbi:MAG TPA: Npt1/Npt2 family nucleotide transporter [Candidatus Limnocylindrales bacterium]|nr:Npt1/Npt2 family nucleotide transporter [Candidatus Limnocylindrales bacterium]